MQIPMIEAKGYYVVRINRASKSETPILHTKNKLWAIILAYYIDKKSQCDKNFKDHYLTIIPRSEFCDWN